MNTTTTQFIVHVYCDDATLTVETNFTDVMLDHFETALKGDVPCEVICGTTGEILASHNCSCGEYVTDAFVGLFLAEAMTQLMN